MNGILETQAMLSALGHISKSVERIANAVEAPKPAPLTQSEAVAHLIVGVVLEKLVSDYETGEQNGGTLEKLFRDYEKKQKNSQPNTEECCKEMVKMIQAIAEDHLKKGSLLQ